MTGNRKALYDPADFEKNDGASAPETAVVLVWPGADFFPDLFSEVHVGNIRDACFCGVPGKTAGVLAKLHHAIQRPSLWGPWGPQAQKCTQEVP